MRIRKAIATVPAVAALAVSPVTALASGPGWTLGNPPAAPNSIEGQLAAIACTSTKFCVAVGLYVVQGGPTDNESTLVERWNGKGWVVAASPNVSGALQNSLNAVSCAAANACIAVGSSFSSTGNHNTTLAEAWDGSTWTIQSTPNPTSCDCGTLSSVSCTASNACTAVGRAVDASGNSITLAERWNGSSWTIQPTPNPLVSQLAGSLYGVSCETSTFCVAVGTYRDANEVRGNHAFAEAWNGSTWVMWPAAQPSGALESYLSGVSCTAATGCVAAGKYDYASQPDEYFAMAERLDGVGATVWPTNLGDSAFAGISCAAGTCTASGAATLSTYAEHWNGRTWAVQRSTEPPNSAIADLNAIACVSATWCMAVGSSAPLNQPSEPLAEGGSSWVVTPTVDPQSGSGSSLTAVSCSSPSACVAIGYSSSSSGAVSALGESWNGKTWAIKALVNPTGSQGSQLNGVSCASATACVAVGTYADATGAIRSLGERWNGKSWSLLSTVDPSGGTRVVLQAVSCVSAAACTAVGSYRNTSGVTTTLAEAWNGSVWTRQTTPPPTAAQQSLLLGVSCTSGSACTAVGDYTDSSGHLLTLGERWNGSSWVEQLTANPSGATFNVLNGVSCATATGCVAVGSSGTSPSGSLTEVWDGTTWSIKAVPDPSGASGSGLNGVSCTASNACRAVGDYSSGGSELTLAERWNGKKWTVEPTPNPIDSTNSVLSGVSCSKATACMAVGNDANTAGSRLTLAEA